MRKPFARRTLLRGAGGVLIGLPFLEEMRPRDARAQTAAPPMRLITDVLRSRRRARRNAEEVRRPARAVSAVREQDGHLHQPRAQASARLRLRRAALQGWRRHLRGRSAEEGVRGLGPVAGTDGEEAASSEGGPHAAWLEIGGDVVPHRFRLAVHAALELGRQPGERPERRPTRIFQQLFGGRPPTGTPTDPAAVAERHLKRSVLDAIIGEYKHYTGDASPLGAESKASWPFTWITSATSRRARAHRDRHRRRHGRGAEELHDPDRRHRSGNGRALRPGPGRIRRSARGFSTRTSWQRSSCRGS